MSAAVITSELDQHLADARRRLALTNPQPQQPQEPLTMNMNTNPQPPAPQQPAPANEAEVTSSPDRGARLKAALNFGAPPIKKTGSAGADVARPAAPKAEDIGARELSLAPIGPGVVARILEILRSIILRLFGVFGVVSASAQAVAPAAVDPRDAELASLRAELAATKAELGKLRAAASAAGLSLEHADVVEAKTSTALEFAATALAHDRRRDEVRAAREAALPGAGDAFVSALRQAGAAVAAIQPGHAHAAEAEVARAALSKAAHEANTWARGATTVLKNAGPEKAAVLQLQIDAIAQSGALGAAAAAALGAADAQAQADQQAANEEAECAPERAPSVLDAKDPAGAAAYRAAYISASRLIRMAHAHFVSVPKVGEDELNAQPSVAAREALLREREEKLRMARAAHEERLLELYDAQRQAASALWPDSDLAGDDDDQERPQ